VAFLSLVQALQVCHPLSPSQFSWTFETPIIDASNPPKLLRRINPQFHSEVQMRHCSSLHFSGWNQL
jgi:hypothetical protein